MKEILNQIFEIEQKTKKNNISVINRNLKRIYHEMEQMGFVLKNPIGEKFSIERTDVEATLMNDLSADLKIVKVLKPIVYKKEGESFLIVQKGVVIVE